MFELFEETYTYENASFPEPRAFQVTARELLRQGFKQGHQRQLLMAPTGAGKSYIGLWLIHECLKQGKKAVFLCDRTTLINQTSTTADKYGLAAHGIVQANHWRRNTRYPFQIASAQTIAKREFWPDADLLVIDEAHTQYKVWTDYIGKTKAAVIGLSATPFSDGLGRHFTNLVNATTMHELTQAGVLVPMRIFSCKKIDMKGAKTANGEWTDAEAAKRGMEIIGDVVSEWVKFAENRKTIIFGANIKHCEEICKQFLNVGIMAAVFTSDTKEAEREYLLSEFRKPDATLRVLISVEALAKGFDVPDVGCVVDCRPLRKSLSTAIQMWGRGLRSSPETGKTDCILLDHSGNITRFVEDYTDIYFNGLDALDTGEKLDKTIRKDDEKKEKEGCPQCGFKPFYKRCMSCGHEVQSSSLVEYQAGEMVEITHAVMAGKKKLAEDHRHLWEQVCTYSRAHSKPEKQRGRAYYLYKEMTGKNPVWSFEEAPDIEITKNVLNRIRSRNIAFVKAKSKGAAHAVH